MFQISNKQHQEIVEFLAEFVKFAYSGSNSGNLKLYNQGRRASVLVNKLMRKQPIESENNKELAAG